MLIFSPKIGPAELLIKKKVAYFLAKNRAELLKKKVAYKKVYGKYGSLILFAAPPHASIRCELSLIKKITSHRGRHNNCARCV